MAQNLGARGPRVVVYSAVWLLSKARHAPQDQKPTRISDSQPYLAANAAALGAAAPLNLEDLQLAQKRKQITKKEIRIYRRNRPLYFARLVKPPRSGICI